MKYAVQLVLFVLTAVVTAGCFLGGTYPRLLRGAVRRAALPVQLFLPAQPLPPASAALPLLTVSARPARPGNDRRAALILLIQAARCAGLGARVAAARPARQKASPGRGPPPGTHRRPPPELL